MLKGRNPNETVETYGLNVRFLTVTLFPNAVAFRVSCAGQTNPTNMTRTHKVTGIEKR